MSPRRPPLLHGKRGRTHRLQNPLKSETSMTDIFSTIERSRIMARIHSVNTRPERLLRSLLSKQGFRLRLHVHSLPGKPDIVIPRCRTAIFVNGCFWHNHAGCRRASFPATRVRFWRTKILGNASRDRRNKAALRKLGWRVITVWQCQLAPKKVEKRLTSLLALLQPNSPAGNDRRALKPAVADRCNGARVPSYRRPSC
jgi:DNA mismatch endonuclease, patch repair protein